MKKLLLSLSALIILVSPKLMAQIIPNLGFETWTTNQYSQNNAPDPNGGNGTAGWWEFNVTSSSFIGSSPLTVFKDSTAPAPYSGKYCAKIVSNAMTTTTYSLVKGYGFKYPDTNGIMFTGYVDLNLSMLSATFKTGIPCNNQLKSYSFRYRYIPNGSDTASCTIAMYHWNSAAKNRTLLGGGIWVTSSTVTNWTDQSVPIYYYTDSIHVMPDTVLVIFSACSIYSKPKMGDTLNIDSGNVVLGINNITSAENVRVNLFPNPASTQITLAVTSQIQANHIEVYDITGKLIDTYTMHNNLLTINTQQYNNGIYFYRMYDDTGMQLNVGKFSVIK
jgi:hypothetical protein